MAWIAGGIAAAGLVSNVLGGQKASQRANRAEDVIERSGTKARNDLKDLQSQTVNQLIDYSNQQQQNYAGAQQSYDQNFNKFYQDAMQVGSNMPAAASVSAPGPLDTRKVDRATGDYQDYIGAGQDSLAAMMDMTGLGDGGYEFEATPGYDFRRDEALRGLEGSAAARGGLYSGGAMRQLEALGDSLAAQEYENVYGRLAGQATMGQNAINANVAAQNQLLGTQANYNSNLYGTASQLAASNYATESGNYRANLNNLSNLQGNYLNNQGNQLMNQQGYAHDAALAPIMVNDAYGQQLAQMTINKGLTRASAKMGQGATAAQNSANTSNALFGLAGGMLGNSGMPTQYTPASFDSGNTGPNSYFDNTSSGWSL